MLARFFYVAIVLYIKLFSIWVLRTCFWFCLYQFKVNVKTFALFFFLLLKAGHMGLDHLGYEN